MEAFFDFIDQLTTDFRFVCDSRQVTPGAIFVALKGEKLNGHDFVQEALLKGALAAVVEESFLLRGNNIFPAQDPLALVRALAKRNLEQAKPKVIGITGSCGKTTTKHFLEHLLKEAYRVFATPGNFNSQIGLPLALASLKKEDEIAILEMGMTHAGDITKLLEWIKLDYAIITSIGMSHAANFIDQDKGIARAKGEILRDQPYSFFNDQVFLYAPFDRALQSHLLPRAGIVKTAEGVAFEIEGHLRGPFRLNFDAPHLIEDLHLALALAYHLGVTDEMVIRALKTLFPQKQRLSLHKVGGVEFIDDSYNASPTSMQQAILYLKARPAKRKICVLGAMRELGESSQKAHLDLQQLLVSGVDQLYFLGEEMKEVSSLLKGAHFNSLEHLKISLERQLQAGDLVLVKGSNSTKLHTLIDSLEIKDLF